MVASPPRDTNDCLGAAHIHPCLGVRCRAHANPEILNISGRLAHMCPNTRQINKFTNPESQEPWLVGHI